MKPIILSGHLRPITQIKFNKESDLMFTGSSDKLIILWNAESGERIGTFLHEAAISTMVISTDSKLLISGDRLGKLYFWDVYTGKLIKAITFDTKDSFANLTSIDLSYGDKDLLAVYNNRGQAWSHIDIFDLNEVLTKDKAVHKYRLKEEKSKFSLAKFTDINKAVYYTLENGTMGKREVETGNIIAENKVHKDIIQDFDLSPMHEIVLTASKDQSSAVLNGQTLEVMNRFEPKNPLRKINTCKIFPLFGSKDVDDDGTYHCAIAGGQEARDVTTTASREGGFEILLYNLMYGDERGAIYAHFGPVNTLAFSPNGKMLASGSEDASIKVHKMEENYYSY